MHVNLRFAVLSRVCTSGYKLSLFLYPFISYQLEVTFFLFLPTNSLWLWLILMPSTTLGEHNQTIILKTVENNTMINHWREPGLFINHCHLHSWVPHISCLLTDSVRGERLNTSLMRLTCCVCVQFHERKLLDVWGCCTCKALSWNGLRAANWADDGHCGLHF